MSEKINEEDDDFEDETEDMLDDFEDVDDGPVLFSDSGAARRRLEQLQEERALQRLLNGDFDDYY